MLHSLARSCIISQPMTLAPIVLKAREFSLKIQSDSGGGEDKENRRPREEEPLFFFNTPAAAVAMKSHRRDRS